MSDARLELGAGGGLVGLAVAIGCSLSSELIISDQENLKELMDININLNNLQSNVKSLVLNWYDSLPYIPSLSCLHTSRSLFHSDTLFLIFMTRGEPLPSEITQQKPNIILAADCVYFEPAFPLLLTTLEDLLALNSEAVIFFCFKKRRRADMQFMKSARKKFLVEEIEDVEREKFSREALFLYTFKKK